MLVFWDVDSQNDFMNKDGKLYIKGAEEIKPQLKKLTEFAINNNILILGSADRHFKDDNELKIFPPHCMNNMEGQQRIPETKTNAVIIENKIGQFGSYVEYQNNEVITFIKASRNSIIFEKQDIDVFTNLNVDKFIIQLDVTVAVVYGVSTEFCVREAVIGLLKRGIKVWIVIDAIEGINKDDAKTALQEMVNKGARLITVNDVLNHEFQNI